ncbi:MULTISPECIES: hypothetical protein [unclassified Pseudomonas]|uniref:hypothetical protein n=1 Tax=unclassified Pseudomonas TaxID=196821 RepID=UPI00146335A5|nr:MULTISPECIES: hypothetical protein [unclassified Pseudomonas]QJI20046.1 hypothetical protein HKK57_17715 [Pseudomonas sp. ADAK21]QJI24801.1 hypothetical protein HKK56_15375 [Pseudomonas sp. ADAK20]
MNLLKLIILIIAPAIFTTLVISSIFNKKQFQLTEAFKHLTLNPDIGLAKQPLFWLSICTPAAYFITFGFVSWSGYDISISAEGFKNFIAISTLPIALLSLSIPLGVIVARFHSTEQTARQILIAKQKNNLDAFYSHRKEFFAYFEKIGDVTFLDTFEVKYQVNPKLHGLLFEGTPENGTPEINNELISLLIEKVDLIRLGLNEVLLDRNPDETLNWYMTAANEIYWISAKLGIREIYNQLSNASETIIGRSQDGSFRRQRSIGTTTIQAICAFRYVKSYILTILHFAGDKRSVDKIYENEIDYIDATGGYAIVNMNGLVIERNFSHESATPWIVAQKP